VTELQAGAIAEFLSGVGIRAQRQQGKVGWRVRVDGQARYWLLADRSVGRWELLEVQGKETGVLPVDVRATNNLRAVAFGVLRALARRLTTDYALVAEATETEPAAVLLPWRKEKT